MSAEKHQPTPEEISAAYAEPEGPLHFLVTGPVLGEGNENTVRPGKVLIETDATVKCPLGLDIKPGLNDWVIKILSDNIFRRLFSRFWRNREDYEKMIDLMSQNWGEKQEPIPFTSTHVKKNAAIYSSLEHGPDKIEEVALISPRINDLIKKILDFPKMVDLRTGQKTINETVDLIDQARDMADKTGYGLDIVGMDSVMEIIRAVPPGLLLQIIDTLPPSVAAILRANITGKNVHIANLAKRRNPTHPGKTVESIDTGPLLLKKDPFLLDLLPFIFELSMAGLTEYTLTANQVLADMQRRPPDQAVIDKLNRVKARTRAKHPEFKHYETFSIYAMKAIRPSLEKYVEDLPGINDPRQESEHPFKDALNEALSSCRAKIAEIVANSELSRYIKQPEIFEPLDKSQSASI